MKRNEFLKSACSFGLCGCFGMSLLNGRIAIAGSESPDSDNQPDWRIEFMQSRYKNLIDILNNSLDKETLIPILNQLGSKCGDDFANKYKDNPEGFFDFIKGMWAESVEVDKENGIIRVNENKRDTCNCPLVKGKDASEVLCN